MSESRQADASAAGTIAIGGDLHVNRLGFGAMRLTGPGIWGEPKDPAIAQRVLQRAVHSVSISSTPRMPTVRR